ncbi:MAG: hypothetical protein IIA59_04095 [Candidatus Marinimicrobia bacterium]|nr:hypothetical protein [Candidatus Neomarinimicrobiota bacterium]
MAWKRKILTVDEINLDANNSRIPPLYDAPKQNEIIHDLVEYEKITELAESIISFQGLYPGENIIAVEINGTYTVVEGNRRIASLKLLLDPEKAPPGKKKKFSNMASQIDPEKIATIEAVIAPDIESTIPIIMNRHANRAMLEWGAINKSIYLFNILKNSADQDATLDNLNITGDDFNSLVRRYVIYKLACEANVPDDRKSRILNPRKFKITVLERLFSYNLFMDRVGLRWDQNDLIIYSDSAQFQLWWGQIVSDIAHPVKMDRLTSRKINSLKDVKKYLDDNNITSDVEDLGKETRVTPFGDDENKKNGSESRKKPYRPRGSAGIIPESFECTVRNKRIQALTKSLKTISYRSHRDIVVIGLRALLEMGLSYFLVKTKYMDELIRIKKPKDAKGSWAPGLRPMALFVSEHHEIMAGDPQAKRVLGHMIKEKGNILSIDILNLFAHNIHYSSTSEKIREIWDGLENIFTVLLTEPS